MNQCFVMRANERGYQKFLSTGEASSYIGGHPDSVVTRHSSFNFGTYQEGRAGFGRVRVFGDEYFRGTGCGYNIHPHHNFVICAFVLEGQLTHVNTVGNIDQLGHGDFYAFSAGSGGKHCEVNLKPEEANIIYVWMLPDELFAPPSYQRAHFDAVGQKNRLVPLVGNADGAIRIRQDAKISRLVTDRAMTIDYVPRTPSHGVYVFVVDGEATCNGSKLGRRDSAGVWGEASFSITTGDEDTDLLIVESAP
jgi:quercetin 2,3-dioxygenase